MATEKLCPKCGIVKPYSEYHMHRTGRKAGKPQTYCKECDAKRSHDEHVANRETENHIQRLKYYQNREAEKARRRKYYQDHQSEEQQKGRERWYSKGGKPASENPLCSKYIGDFAEKALSTFFKTMIKMPADNPGYDFLCGKGFKIDVKSSCLLYRLNDTPHWKININKNVEADYFLILLFDSRTDKNPMHVYLIPGSHINMLQGISIRNAPESLAKYSKYERPIDTVLSCCRKIKNEEDDVEETILL